MGVLRSNFDVTFNSIDSNVHLDFDTSSDKIERFRESFNRSKQQQQQQ